MKKSRSASPGFKRNAGVARQRAAMRSVRAQLTGCNAKPAGSTCRLQRTSARPWASHAGWQCSLGLFIGVTSVASGGNRHSLNTRARDYLTGRLVCGGRLRGWAGGPVTPPRRLCISYFCTLLPPLMYMSFMGGEGFQFGGSWLLNLNHVCGPA